MRILLWLRDPDIEVVVQTGKNAHRFSGSHRGRAVFTDQELDQVLDLKPSPSEFRVICAAKTALSGRVVAAEARDSDTVVDESYSDDDELMT